MFWLPGYLLADETRAKPVIEIKAKWYSKLTDWVVSKPLNAVLIFVLTLAFSALFFDIYTLGFTLFFVVIFAVWILITGSKNFKKKIGGAYSTVAGALNVALIILSICAIAFFSYAPQTATEYVPVEQIQITEMSGEAPVAVTE
jgi:membrane-bound ClpP family serine protease